MVYKNIQRIDWQTIQRFADIYGFPNDEFAISLFQQIHGGVPRGLYICIIECGELKRVYVERLLTFDDGDYSIEDAMHSLCFDVDGVIPLALCENGGYLCYICKTGEICLCDEDASQFWGVVCENGEPYTLNELYDDLKP